MLNRRNIVVGAGLTFFAAGLRAETLEKVPVVASFSILADFVSQVGGERVNVTALVGANGDAHVFSPSPTDARMVAAARVLVVNGLGLEGWMQRLLTAAGTTAPIITTTNGIAPQRFEEGGKVSDDPHAWQNIGYAKVYIANIRDGLAAADPAGAAEYAANAQAYLGKLDKLEAEVRAAIATIPVKNRQIITSHDAFGYFGTAYGMKFIAPQGVSTEAEASARDVARIIRQIKAEKIPAVFMENINDPRLIQRIAKETGARIGGKLFSDALSEPGGAAATYVDMMKNNIAAFTTALVG